METRKGIGAANRQLLDQLHREIGRPFRVREAAKVLRLEQGKARRLFAQFADLGWLSRITHDAYALVPLGASSPADWHEDPWNVAALVFAPCYMGGWTACEHWSLTEQIFRDVVVYTQKPLRKRIGEIQGTTYHLKTIQKKAMFGLSTVWHDQNKIRVSDPSRTIVDLLDTPSMGGGILHVSEIVTNYFSGQLRDDEKLADYIRRLGNRTVYKRLGYLIEALKIDALSLEKTCAKNMSSGVSPLDPSMKNEGHVMKRWNLRLNARIGDNG